MNINYYPGNKTLLPFRHGVIYWLPPSEKLKKNNSKAVNITLLSYLPCHCIPEENMGTSVDSQAKLPNFFFYFSLNLDNIDINQTHSGAWYPKVPRTRVEWRRAAVSEDWLVKLKSAILAR